MVSMATHKGVLVSNWAGVSYNFMDAFVEKSKSVYFMNKCLKKNLL